MCLCTGSVAVASGMRPTGPSSPRGPNGIALIAQGTSHLPDCGKLPAMRRESWRTPRALVIVAAALIGAMARDLSGQSIGRTADGRPDLQGMWVNDTATPLERPQQFAGRAVVSDEEARAFEQRYQVDRLMQSVPRDKAFEVEAAAGDIATYEPGRMLPGGRTSMIIEPSDGKVPALTPNAQRRVADRARHLEQHYADNPEDMPNGERCLAIANTAIPPLLPLFYNNSVQIIQTNDYVVIVSEMIHDARIIPIGGRGDHLPREIAQWKGDSIGRWDGDTLVVDTTNFSDKSSLRGSGPQLHVIERFTLGSDRNRLVYQFTIDDPDSFTQRWIAESALSRTDGRMFEYACHEGNYSMASTLRGARFAEREQVGR
jgi:hypothetical protein